MDDSLLTTQEFRDAVRTNIIGARGVKRLSQAETSTLIGLSSTGYNMIETGKNTPSSMTLFKLSMVLEVSIDRLYPSQMQIQRALQRR